MKTPWYRFKKRVYKKRNNSGLDKAIDATYIIHLEGNGRLPNIKKQLRVFKPSRVVYILFNKGFKETDKDLPRRTAPEDLIDAFLHVFRHAARKGYDNILVLEDDFIFDPKIMDPRICRDISTFLSNKKREKQTRSDSFIYLLGSIPFIRGPYSGNHNRLLLSCGMHACIYSKFARESVLSIDREKIGDWDVYHNIYNFQNKYTYYQPLCYQLFPCTANSEVWSKYYCNMGKGVYFLFKMFGLDNSVEPGYTAFYIFSLLQYYYWIILFSVVLFYV